MQRHRIAARPARPSHALASPAPSLVPPFRPLRPRQARIPYRRAILLLIGCGYGLQQRPSVLELRQPATGRQRSSLSHHALNLPPARLPLGSSAQYAIVPAASLRRGLPAPGLLCAEPAVSRPSSDERLSQRCLSPAVWRAWHQRPEHGLGSPVLPSEPRRQRRKGRPICWSRTILRTATNCGRLRAAGQLWQLRASFAYPGRCVLARISAYPREEP